MGMLINGQWQTTKPVATKDENGNFIRAESSFRHQIRPDSAADFKPEANRYHLYISYACPWASRTIIFRQLKKLETIISMSTVHPLMLDHGWEFTEQGESQDPLYHQQYLYQLYQAADPHCTGKVTVPVLWDKQHKTIVNNESSEIIRLFNSAFNVLSGDTSDYYPSHLQTEIDEINDFIYQHINNGVYRCGFAGTQAAYDKAFDSLFNALDAVEERLADNRYLVGAQLTEADWRLFTTLVRFDVVYVGHFKCNKKRIDDYPNLSNYLRELYQRPGIDATVRFDHIKNHYYASHRFINPTGIVPKGPILNLYLPHNRHEIK